MTGIFYSCLNEMQPVFLSPFSSCHFYWLVFTGIYLLFDRNQSNNLSPSADEECNSRFNELLHEEFNAQNHRIWLK